MRSAAAVFHCVGSGFHLPGSIPDFSQSTALLTWRFKCFAPGALRAIAACFVSGGLIG